MSYSVTLSAADVETLRWLDAHGYTGNFLDHATLLDEDENGATFGLTEPEAWGWTEDIEADPHAFLTCCGSDTLVEALWKLCDRIV